MSRVSDSESERLAWERSPEPGWIESPDGPLFCWYHPPRGTPRDCAVLLCDTIGSHRMNLHLTYRHLALRLSAAGFPTMRFDYAGTGDSSGSAREASTPTAWLNGIESAAAALGRRSGVHRLSLFGARLGGTLAARFADDQANEKHSAVIEDLVLWGAHPDGRTFLRAERALDRFGSPDRSGRRPACARPGDEEYLGFLYSARTIAELQDLRLSDLRGAMARRARVIAWDSFSEDEKLARQLDAQGIPTDTERLEGLRSEESLTHQAVPEILLDAIARWLVAGHSRVMPDEAGPPESARKPLPTTVTLDAVEPGAPAIVEETVYLGPERDLFGLHTRSLDPGRRAPFLILVSSGNNHRAGINRNHTEWSRAAARNGTDALRFDIRGLGDSPPLRATDLNVLYRPETLDDVVAAIDFASDVAPERPVVLCGLCAGAFQVLHAALRDTRVGVAILLDPLRWDLQPPPRWRRGFLHRRWESLRGALLWAGSPLIALLRRLRSLSTADARESLGDQLLTLTRRGVTVVVVTSRSGAGHPRLCEAIGARLKEIEGTRRFQLESLDDTNHIFSPLWSQEWLTRLILETLAGLASSTPRHGGDAKNAPAAGTDPTSTGHPARSSLYVSKELR